MTDDQKQKPVADNPDETTWREAPWLALKGILMGSADIIPGVSGGTMALITGIYDRLVNAVSSVDSRTVSSLLRFRFSELFRTFHWKFLLILLSGIIAAIIFFTRVVPLQVYMHTHPEIVYGLFFGLILGSVYILLREIEPGERHAGAWTALLLGTLAGFWIVNLVPADTPESFLFIFLSGMLALCAMILPGISGSYILLILGKYDYVLTQLAGIGGEDTVQVLWALLPLALGGVTGLALFSRVLSWLLSRHHAVTLMTLTGIMIGALYVIWPYQERTYRDVVTHVELVDVADPLVQQLRQEPPDTLAPSYVRLGDVRDPGPATGEPVLVEVEHVERNPVHSTPFVPGLAERDPPHPYSLRGGLYGIFTGLVLVVALDYLRRMK